MPHPECKRHGDTPGGLRDSRLFTTFDTALEASATVSEDEELPKHSPVSLKGNFKRTFFPHNVPSSPIFNPNTYFSNLSTQVVLFIWLSFWQLLQLHAQKKRAQNLAKSRTRPVQQAGYGATPPAPRGGPTFLKPLLWNTTFVGGWHA